MIRFARSWLSTYSRPKSSSVVFFRFFFIVVAEKPTDRTDVVRDDLKLS